MNLRIHVGRDDSEANGWLSPEIRVACNSGHNAHTLRDLREIAESSDGRTLVHRQEFVIPCPHYV